MFQLALIKKKKKNDIGLPHHCMPACACMAQIMSVASVWHELSAGTHQMELQYSLGLPPPLEVSLAMQNLALVTPICRGGVATCTGSMLAGMQSC